jgi:hypothetical protein
MKEKKRRLSERERSLLLEEFHAGTKLRGLM